MTTQRKRPSYTNKLTATHSKLQPSTDVRTSTVGVRTFIVDGCTSTDGGCSLSRSAVNLASAAKHFSKRMFQNRHILIHKHRQNTNIFFMRRFTMYVSLF